jgi:hypothetical protein
VSAAEIPTDGLRQALLALISEEAASLAEATEPASDPQDSTDARAHCMRLAALAELVEVVGWPAIHDPQPTITVDAIQHSWAATAALDAVIDRAEQIAQLADVDDAEAAGEALARRQEALRARTKICEANRRIGVMIAPRPAWE